MQLTCEQTQYIRQLRFFMGGKLTYNVNKEPLSRSGVPVQEELLPVIVYNVILHVDR